METATTCMLTPVATYFDRLDNGQLEEAAELFAVNAVYYHTKPFTPYSADEVTVFRGRAAILDMFEQRGPVDTRHEMLSVVTNIDDHWVVGRLVLDGKLSSVFFVRAILDDDGLIVDYVATGGPSVAPHLAELHGTT